MNKKKLSIAILAFISLGFAQKSLATSYSIENQTNQKMYVIISFEEKLGCGSTKKYFIDPKKTVTLSVPLNCELKAIWAHDTTNVMNVMEPDNPEFTTRLYLPTSSNNVLPIAGYKKGMMWTNEFFIELGKKGTIREGRLSIGIKQ